MSTEPQPQPEPYDSTHDTLQHIHRVQELLADLCLQLTERGIVHDVSKLNQPEKDLFDRMTPLLKDLEYGSEEYRAALVELKPALDHHYANNSHHPEFYENGIDGMSLLDLVEMFADWKAASERHASGNVEKSIQINSKRFGMSPQLTAIFENTRRELGW